MERELDIDINIPKNEQLPTQLFKRYDTLIKWNDPLVKGAFVVAGFMGFQFLGAIIKLHFLTRLMWWAALLVVLAAATAFLMPSKYRFLYLASLIVAVGMGMLW